MKKTIITAFLLLPFLAAMAGSPEVKQVWKDYSRWSVGINGGVSLMWGDFKSVGYDDTHIGGVGELQVGYQISPTFGLRLSGAYGYNVLCAKDYEKDYRLGVNGITQYGWANYAPLFGDPIRTAPYSELESQVRSYTLGLNVETNINNLFGNKPERRWTVLVSPGVYLQKFSPVVHYNSGGVRFTTTDIYNGWHMSLGGDVALRFRASRTIDLQAKTYGIWILEENFDGVISAGDQKKSGVAGAMLGVIWKINCKGSKDNLLYAPMRNYILRDELAKKPKEIEVIRTETRVVEKPVEKVIIKEVGTQELQCDLPTVHFVRNSSVIDEQKYGLELHTIVTALKNAPKVKFQIWGFCDHTGGKTINDNLSYARAEALKAYLIDNGIAADRIVSIVGLGKDPSLTGEEAYSVKARRAAVVND